MAGYGFVVVIVFRYLGFLLIGILVYHVVSLRMCVVLWVKVMALHGSWQTKCILRVVFVGNG